MLRSARESMKIVRVSSPSVRVSLRSAWLFWSFVLCVVTSYVCESSADTNQWCPGLNDTIQKKLEEIDGNLKSSVQLGCLSPRRITDITLSRYNNVTKVYFRLPSTAIYVNASWLFEWIIAPLFVLVDEASYYSSTTSSIPKMSKFNAPIFSNYNTSGTMIKKTVGLQDGFKVAPNSGELQMFSNASVSANITANDIVCILKVCVWKPQDSKININDAELNNNLSVIVSLPIYNESAALYDTRSRHNYSITQRHVTRRSNTAALAAVLVFIIVMFFVAAFFGYFYRSTLARHLSVLTTLQSRQSDRKPA
ncbi:m03 protein [Murid betaherpesvirus 1]|uniref:M03 protein n=1 Tax=Murid herpesvirus 1 TaxID=10366 RepID=H2A160_MUHV1|nr:m03 protein [Murid betaherpesvirus 1]